MSEMVRGTGHRLAALTSMTVGTLGVMLALAGSASATPVDPIETAFDGLSAKITLYGGFIVALVVLSVGIFLGIKYLRKGVSKA